MFLTCKTIEEAKAKGMKVGENVSFVNMPHDDFLYMVSLPPEEKKQYLLKKFNIK